ncbi:MAG: recombination mediator RecR [Candidatus Paceibacteria bacterium]
MEPLVPQSLNELIEQLSQLPGVGRKSAMRYAFWLMDQEQDYLNALGDRIKHLKEAVILCEHCFRSFDEKICDICRSPDRDKTTICVVETTEDLVQIERTGDYTGVYHVLGGAIDPLKGVNPQDLTLAELRDHITYNEATEVIVATNPTVQGDTTVTYIRNMFQDTSNLKITTLGRGLATGAELEYLDGDTVKNALRNRR